MQYSKSAATQPRSPWISKEYLHLSLTERWRLLNLSLLLVLLWNELPDCAVSRHHNTQLPFRLLDQWEAMIGGSGKKRHGMVWFLKNRASEHLRLISSPQSWHSAPHPQDLDSKPYPWLIAMSTCSREQNGDQDLQDQILIPKLNKLCSLYLKSSSP